MDVQPLSEKARLALANPSPSIEAYEGSVRSGKTITTLIDWARFIRTGPPGALAMCGRTERTVINNLILPMQEIFGRQRVKINYGTGVVTIFGRTVYVYGANNEQSRTKIQGATLAGAYADEATTMPESFFNMLYTRLSVPGAKLWLTANPEGPRHWLKVKWLDRARLWIDGKGRTHINDGAGVLELHRYTFLLDDNDTLDPAYVERTKRSYTGMFHRRYIEAQWVASEGAIFDMWDPDTHVIAHEDIPPLLRMFSVGIDYGTTNATSAVALGLGTDGILYAVDEWRHEATGQQLRYTDAQLSAGVRGFLRDLPVPPEWVIVDPAAASFKVQLASEGVRNIMNGENDVLYGIRATASLLSLGKLRVSDRCTGLLDELPSYSWDPKATDEGLDKPLKVADHSTDALRYAIATTETLWRPYLDAPT